MPGLLAKYAAAKAKVEADERRSDLPRTDHIPPNEQRALKLLRQEAKRRGATLESGGKGGLPSTLVLGAFRKCGYRCTKCGGRKRLTVHHVGGIVTSPRTSRLGHQNKQSNLTILCAKCHDQLHEEARREGVDSSQVTPSGDVGNPRRDHGKPVDPG